MQDQTIAQPSPVATSPSFEHSEELTTTLPDHALEEPRSVAAGMEGLPNDFSVEVTGELVSDELPEPIPISLTLSKDGAIATSSENEPVIGLTGRLVRPLVEDLAGVLASPISGSWPPQLKALVAREAVLTGKQSLLREFSATVLGLWSDWDEAVATALLGNWDSPLQTNGRLCPDALNTLRQHVRVAHAQSRPLWMRRAGGFVWKGRRVEAKRVALLETPGSAGVTLRDILADGSCPEDHLLGLIPGDQRLGRVLAALDPEERAVVLALGFAKVGNWQEAAEHVGADDPQALAARVRRKARRLAEEETRRQSLRHSEPASLWKPEQMERSA
ncbi:hypothetical protein ABTX82_27835 [Streptomyces lavendulae]|uniref:hypothetical protein n=1 Tax=Streptomyces lavendulae TaxID=1914 RepID=UPI0033233A72